MYWVKKSYTRFLHLELEGFRIPLKKTERRNFCVRRIEIAVMLGDSVHPSEKNMGLPQLKGGRFSCEGAISLFQYVGWG